MARARNLKPSLFKNELLGMADPLLTILFQSLWCLADREGRLEDRPLRIKAETFPYREGIDVNVYLTELERLQFICRYEVDSKRVIQVLNFAKHQNPHKTEKQSSLPENPYKSDSCDVTDIAPLNNGTCRADSLLLIPDSLLETSCAIDAQKSGKPEQKQKKQQAEYSDDFEAAWSAYPARAGGDSKKDAYRHWCARLKEGVTVQQMQEGVKRYAAFSKATGKLNTEFVMQATRFFGTGRNFEQPWTAPIQNRNNGRPSINAPFEAGVDDDIFNQMRRG